MKFATVSKSLFMGLALLLATSAFAATKGSLQLTSPVTVNGTMLKAGDYRVEWDGAGPNVESASSTARSGWQKFPPMWSRWRSRRTHDAALTQKNGSGPDTLAGVRFEGKKFELDLGQGDGMQSGGSSR